MESSIYKNSWETYACVSMYVCICVFVCVCEREREERNIINIKATKYDLLLEN